MSDLDEIRTEVELDIRYEHLLYQLDAKSIMWDGHCDTRAGTSLQQTHDKLHTLPLRCSSEARITSTVVVDGRYESLVIWGGQIASLGPLAICRLAKLIPLHWMGLPGSYPTAPYSTPPTPPPTKTQHMSHCVTSILTLTCITFVPSPACWRLAQLWLIFINLFLSLWHTWDI